MYSFFNGLMIQCEHVLGVLRDSILVECFGLRDRCTNRLADIAREGDGGF